MKVLWTLALPLVAASAFAQDTHIKGRYKFMDPGPEVVIMVDTPHGLKRVSLGSAENWRGRMFWLDNNDLVSVSGRMDSASGNIIAEKVWVNGNFYFLPSGPMRNDD
jgi:hypothetical protein